MEKGNICPVCENHTKETKSYTYCPFCGFNHDKNEKGNRPIPVSDGDNMNFTDLNL
jgi:predicted amidophosphoribosyltransferase